MLVTYGFSTVALVLGDLFFYDPEPGPGQNGPERGVRMELRQLGTGSPPESLYASTNIVIGAPLWRIDLLESATGPAGTFDRTHHHPTVEGWEPGDRVFDTALSADPVGWVANTLSHLNGHVGPDEQAEITKSVPAIRRQLEEVLAAVHTGALAPAPAGHLAPPLRIGWL
jgi:hypothetical protein